MKQHGYCRKVKNGGESKEHSAWRSMKDRCNNPNHPKYKNHGGRGVTVCKSWKKRDGFISFLKDMGLAPSKKHTLDRINNYGGYRPGNCRWATEVEQNNNKRNNIVLTFGGETLKIIQWGEKLGIKRSTLISRLWNGWSIERVLTTKVK